MSSNSPIVTSVAYRSNEKPQAIENDEPSQLDACFEKWKHLQPQIKDLKWSECPADFLGDVGRALCHDFKKDFGSSASIQSLNAFAINIAKSGVKEINFSLNHENKSFSLKAFPQSIFVKSEILAKDLDSSFELSLDNVPKNRSESKIKDALKTWSEQEIKETKTFDPSVELTDEEIKSLFVQYDAQGLSRDNFEVWTGIASFLLRWSELEEKNASSSSLAMEGLTEGNEKVAPEQRIVFEFKNEDTLKPKNIKKDGKFVAKINTPKKPKVK